VRDGTGDQRLLRFLDDLRAAEAASTTVLAAWIAVCTHDELRGGLRVIAEREAGHAELLAERLRELGSECTAELAPPVLASALERFGSRDVPDEDKLAQVLARYPDDAAATRSITYIVDEVADDPETCELLRLIAEGENATFAWLRAYRG